MGSFYACLVASNAGGCKDSVCKPIEVTGGDSIGVPNIFTPNGDATNDCFFIKTKGIQSLVISIWDRWGLKMWDFTGSPVPYAQKEIAGGANWDGTKGSGDKCPNGTYYYLIKATATDGKTFNLQGYVALFR